MIDYIITKVLKNQGKNREALFAGLQPPPNRYARKVLTTTVLRKIELLTSKENPPTQTQISKKVKVSVSSLNRATKILKKRIRRKTRVHQLNDK